MIAIVPLAIACVSVQPPVTPHATVPPNTAQKCADICGEMGLTMSAVVVVANQTGCVCEPKPAAGPHAAGAAASAAGAVVALARQAAVQEAIARQGIIFQPQMAPQLPMPNQR